MGYSVGINVTGAFTDFLLVDEKGNLEIAKVILTTIKQRKCYRGKMAELEAHPFFHREVRINRTEEENGKTNNIPMLLR